MQRYRFDGGTAVVTGAASGIGAALSAALADRGSNLALVDCDAPRLHAVAEEIQGRHRGLDVRSYEADLAVTSGLGALAAHICQDLGSLTLLINNAGIALAGTFEQISLTDFEAVMRTNFDATVHLTHHLLPTLKASGGAHVANVSSVYGLVAPPGQTAYAASKFAVRGFSEALRHELSASGVGVTTVHPGGVRTMIAQHARVGANMPPAEAARAGRRAARVLTMDPRVAAEAILDAVEKRKARALVGATAKLPDGLARLAPAHAWQLTRATVGVASRRPRWRRQRDDR